MERIMFDNKTIIKKSNELSTAKLLQGLSLNQMQLFSYCILKTQKTGISSFQKIEFESMFDISRYNSKKAYEDAKALFQMYVTFDDDIKNELAHLHVFHKMTYQYKRGGAFVFEWEPEILPHILELKERYVMIDLTITSRFKSGFSWTLYELLKASYGRSTLSYSKQEIMNLFNVSQNKSYISNTSLFRKNCLDVAVEEINNLTEYKIEYDIKKKGRAITGFTIKFWKIKDIRRLATDKQINYIEVLKDSMRYFSVEINKIKDGDQREFAFYLFEEINKKIDYTSNTDSIETVDNIIKDINNKKSLINKIISEDQVIQNSPIDKYAHFDIPIIKNFGHND